jgi:dTDP-4-dehydrorhamnose 3,5-epimerase
MNAVQAVSVTVNTIKKMGTIKKIPTPLSGVLTLEPRVFGDERGFFFESYNQRALAEIGIKEGFVQDNHSSSCRNVVRGLHYQIKQPQAKLVRVVEGEILDVAVDLRRSSPTFGRWAAVLLTADNKRMLWIPVGFAHGFRVISERAQVLYKATDYYAPEHERTLAWNDAQLKIDWGMHEDPIVSAKDRQGISLRAAETFD